MDKQNDLEGKYQKLATEYSKVRSHATVLKKAVLDEQAKVVNLKEIIKTYEQQMRKHDQEMESLTFRNEQLTKRIYVLQEELRISQHGKKGKNKTTDNNVQSNFSILDEELQKKILENAQLASTLADKDIELSNNVEKITWLEEKISKLQENLVETESKYKENIEQIKQEIKDKESDSISLNSNATKCEEADKEKQALIEQLQQEITRWKTQCELLRLKPGEDESLEVYYESKLCELLELKQVAQSETSTLWIENEGMHYRLEKLILEKNALERILEKSNEELHTTSENYKMQLDAMTEHVASQNETITKLSDDIEILNHKLSSKK